VHIEAELRQEHSKAQCDKIVKLSVVGVTAMGEAIAVKAFSLTILENLCKTYPEIVPEIKTKSFRYSGISPD